MVADIAKTILCTPFCHAADIRGFFLAKEKYFDAANNTFV